MSESQLHSFIIKLWLEEASDEGDRTAWRGQIKHVPGGEHMYVKTFEEIADFMSPYLKSTGIEFGPRVRVWRWIQRMRLR